VEGLGIQKLSLERFWGDQDEIGGVLDQRAEETDSLCCPIGVGFLSRWRFGLNAAATWGGGEFVIPYTTARHGPAFLRLVARGSPSSSAIIARSNARV